MENIIKGQKIKLTSKFVQSTFSVKFNMPPIAECEIDVACFGLDYNGKLSDDRYFIFYNQLTSPAGAIKITSSPSVFEVNLSLLPDNISKLVFTATIDGEKSMSALTDANILISSELESFSYHFSGTDFSDEKAIIIAEIYKKENIWRFAAVGNGFNGGLETLLNSFGGEAITQSREHGKTEYVPEPMNESTSSTPDITKKQKKRPNGIASAIKDVFNASKIREENEHLRTIMTPEMQDAAALLEKINELKKDLSKLSKEKEKIDAEIQKKKSLVITLDDEILVQEFGLYEPRYEFQNATEYKEKLDEIRSLQKASIKAGTAATGNIDWTVNGSKAKGKKMVQDMQKLLLRAFNSECDEIIGKVKYNNYEASLKRITASCDAISKLGTLMSIKISKKYYDYKVQELSLALEYTLKKQEEKELAKEARAAMREAAQLQKEIEEERKKSIKEQSHYQQALKNILDQLKLANDTEKADLMDKKAQIESRLNEINAAISQLDYREANQRAGYVYVISNIGSFGENIYKIGMTRRLDPQERIDELGDASVPFNFDVHAMIFSDDAPALEAALHRAFDDRKLNMVNTRREFFNVTLEEIKSVIKENFDKTVEFIDFAEANQYRISKKMKQEHSI